MPSDQPPPNSPQNAPVTTGKDVYFSADVETDGPVPGPFSMLSFALVVAGSYDGQRFERPTSFADSFEAELRPVGSEFQQEALRVNGLDRDRLLVEGRDPVECMSAAAAWVRARAEGATPVLVAWPVSFDWSWLYWYFVRFSRSGSPFSHSRCFDLRTAYAVKSGLPVGAAGSRSLPAALRSSRPHTHRALDDAIEQADIFANLFEWDGR